ncbi:organelle RRM domain-containing protein 2, mitochondrial isoform X1 [Ziziphus jujuba]|uniref:Organelle RRM domain-containing protein 2, mitochondrial isoform X1 n=1 Tax=Ziziphus jujuba TaxID=326968 RepID=A0ABM3I8J5_ZIZJJ|nr:organelle RRM domain-containing protein 2, mitochondrial isoform X1 [Ziziphus jujuba]
MALRTAAAAPRGLRRLFSSISSPSFLPPQTPPAAQAREKPEPSTNLFISGLSKRTTTEKLHEEFAKFGEVVHARVVTDRVSGYSKGFGFVKYATLEDAAKGIEGMDGKALDAKSHSHLAICFWMVGLYLLNMLDPDHHLVRFRTT